MSTSEAPTILPPTLLPLPLQPPKEDLKPKVIVLTATETTDTLAIDDSVQSPKDETDPFSPIPRRCENSLS
ncbi:hypothetical protein FRC14_005131 [Serendipita sp. 396]|nr:hypothetical protein FRC14_005131 [Serendipita sp. 396]KAG8789565.1 hypothetical protein FRC15_006297 [Serendipita sp. 397]KAG8824217.1 hypothetical protein FRC19_002209 [Serendipita sp. 401]KAG8872605.1 hypothetical protein FRC20_009265 [Serendipita sp. 405]KAG9054233.1 hypothetical protein FS842_005722 [Serendipita sp. 407]